MGEGFSVPLPSGERDRLAPASQGEGPRPNNAGERQRLARMARHDPTEAEDKLWSKLRDRRLGGYKFRRQHNVGRARPDFICLSAGLIVEVDGSQHVERAGADAWRTARLNGRGFRVLRVWNNDVMNNIDAVLEAILAALTAPHPGASGACPSPLRGEGLS